MKSLSEIAHLASEVGSWADKWFAEKEIFKCESSPVPPWRSPNSWDMRPTAEIPDVAKEGIKGLEAQFGENALWAAVAFYCLPTASQLPLRWNPKKEHQCRTQVCMVNVCQYFIVEKGTHEAYAMLFDRLKGMLSCEWPLEATRQYLGEDYNPDLPFSPGKYGYLRPHCSELAELLSFCIDPLQHKEELLALAKGEWNSITTEPKYGQEIVQEVNTYATCAYHLRDLIELCLEYALPAGDFSYEDLRRVAGISLRCIHFHFIGVRGNGKDYEDLNPMQLKLREYHKRYAWERYQALNLTDSNESDYILQRQRYGDLERYADDKLKGARWMLKTCEYIEQHDLKAKQVCAKFGILTEVFSGFASVWHFDEGESPEWLIEQLRVFKPATLWLVFPFAGLGQRPILEVLDATTLIPLHEYMMRLVQCPPYLPHKEISVFENGTSETDGVINIQAMEAVLANVSPKLIKAYFKSLKGSKLGYERPIYLFEAVAGTNRTALIKSIARHNQIALKALGAQPLEAESDALERYLLLRKAWKECTKYGAERQANTRAAITIGMKNLANRAGYSDVGQLEWEMELRLSESTQSVMGEQEIGDWTVSIGMVGLKSKLSVVKAGKPLKSIPAGLRKHETYPVLREQMDMINEQARRFRQALEAMMCLGSFIEIENIAKLSSIAAVRFLSANLIGMDEKGRFGLIDAERGLLKGLAGDIPIEGGMRIAHPYDLYQANQLSEWQRELVERNIIQPFKQAFRELYVVTPAEKASSPVSNRYLGKNINTAVAYRLLQSRGWEFAGSEGDGGAVRRYPEEKISAFWAFPGVHHFFSEDEHQVSDTLHFYKAGKSLPVDQVPEKIFSEVMRDADLVVSVAIIDDDGSYWSAELGANRIAIVDEVMRKLGFTNITFDDRHLYVEGKRANYRIHMGSGNIHIMPGAYLCIVPDRPKGKKASPIYLPFAEADNKVTEIISKAILLTDDDCIEDDSINTQIDVGTKV